MPAEQSHVEAVQELLGVTPDDEHQDEDQGTDGPEAQADTVGDEPGDSPVDNTTDDEPVEGGDEGGQAGDSTDPEPLVTVKELAEKLGVDAKDLYNDLAVPLGDGETVTLGEFKDRVKDLRELDAQKEQFTEAQSQASRDSLAQRAEMSELLGLIPAEMREQLVKAAGDRHQGYIQQQQQEVLEAIPEWRDQDTLARDRDAIIALGNEYGFNSQEITATHDARTLRMLHDTVRLRERLNTADANSKKQSKARAGSPGKTQNKRTGSKLKQAVQRAKDSNDPRDQHAAVSEILRNR